MRHIIRVLACLFLCSSCLAVTPTPTASPTPSPSPTASPTATPWGFPIISRHPNKYNTRDITGARFQFNSQPGTSDQPTSLSLGLNMDLNGTIRIRGGAPDAGDFLTAMDTLGSAEWTTPSLAVADALVGTTFTLNGTGDLAAQIESIPEFNTRLPFGSFHEVSNVLSGFSFTGAYRGTLGNMGRLVAADPIGGWFPFVPYNPTEWTNTATYLFADAITSHTLSDHSTRIGLYGGVGHIRIDSDGVVNVASSSAEVSGDWHFADAIDVDDTATVDGLLSANGSILAAQLGTGSGLEVLARVDDNADGAIAIRANAGSTTDNFQGLTIYDKTGSVSSIQTFGGGLINISVFTQDLTAFDAVLGSGASSTLDIQSDAPTAPNLATITPAFVLGINASDEIGVFTSSSSGSNTGDVTLSADAGAFLGLTGQQLTVDSQSAGLFLASPSGGAGVMAPRAIAETDLPARIHRTLASTTTQVGNTALTETDLFTFTVAAGQCSVNQDTLAFTAFGSIAATLAVDKRIRVYQDGDLCMDTGALAITAASKWRIAGTTKRSGATAGKGEGALTNAVVSGEDWNAITPTYASTNVFKITGTGTNASDVVLEGATLEFAPAP